MQEAGRRDSLSRPSKRSTARLCLHTMTYIYKHIHTDRREKDDYTLKSIYRKRIYHILYCIRFFASRQQPICLLTEDIYTHNHTHPDRQIYIKHTHIQTDIHETHTHIHTRHGIQSFCREPIGRRPKRAARPPPATRSNSASPVIHT